MKLLIVDDVPANLRLLRAQLEAEGHEVLDAENGVEGLRVLSRETVDGVVSDILMPEMDGFRFCLEVRKREGLRTLPFVFYTSTYDSPADRQLAGDMGADAYITKPARVADLLDALREALRRVGGPQRAAGTLPDEGYVLKQYSQALVRKLEDKNTDLEATLVNLNSAHEETRRADERYRAMFEKAAVGMTHTDLQGGFVTVNPRFCEITGYAAAEALSLNFRNLTHPEDFERSKQSRAALLEGNAPPYEREVRLLRKDRSVIWARVTTSLMRAADGTPLHFLSVIYDVTERKLAEEAQRESEARFRQLAENIREVFFLIDAASGRTLYVNPAYEQTWQRSAASLYADTMSWTEPIHPDDRASVFATLERLQGSGESDHEYRILRDDGSERWIHARTYPIRDEAGRIFRIAGVAEDITERKLAAEELRESESRLNEAQRNARVGSWRYMADGTFVWSDYMYELIQLPRGVPITHAAIASLVHPDDRVAGAESPFMRAIRTGAAEYTSEYRVISRDGSILSLHSLGKIRRDPQGRLVEAIGTVQDITERKRAAEALRESERRFSDMLGNVQLVSLMLDREARITYCNDYLLRLTGWQREEVIGRNWFEVFIAPESNALEEKFGQLIADAPAAWHVENEILTRSGGRRLIQWNNTVLRSPWGEIVGTASIGEDITVRKEAEQKIKSLNRVYAVLSGINELIVRVRHRDELFAGACKIAVEVGQFRTCWIGIADRDAMKIVPVASAGADPGYMKFVEEHFSLAEDSPMGNTLAAKAIRGKKAFFSNDTQNDPSVGFKKEHIERSSQSIVLLPLLVDDNAVGVLAMYTEEAGFFDAKELTLLTDLAGDIAFSLDHIEKANRLDFLAYYDPLTGLPNRALFQDRLAHQMHGRGGESVTIAVALFDLERFRRVNETLGRQAGDELLRIVAARLKHANEGTARLGIDLFGVALRGAQSIEDVNRAVESIVADAFTDPFMVREAELSIACRIGVAVYPTDGADADSLLRNAEAALRRSKRSGEHMVFYAPEMNARVAEALETENKLRRALARREFVLHYQPKVSIADGRITSVEALIRWQPPGEGLVPPGRFIPILEETGLIVPVGGWAIEQALTDLAAWTAKGFKIGRVAVNVSTIQLQRKDFVDAVIDAVQRAGDNPDGLELEITESLLMHDVDASIRKLAILRGMGIQVSMDDFGTGYSSLSYLARLPVDEIKIDRSFVNGMVGNREDATIVSGIIALVHSLHLKVIAEGVETPEQVQHLAALGCDEAQGYFYSRPVSAAQIEALMRAGGKLPGAGAAQAAN